MTKLRDSDNRWLRDFGLGVTEDFDAAYDFPADEALALCTLQRDVVPDGDGYGDTSLDLRREPHFSPGFGMVWVRHNGRWFAAERQALFMGTRNALRAHRAGTVVA